MSPLPDNPIFFSYGGHAHFFLSAESNLLYCDSVLKLGDEVSDKSLPPPAFSPPHIQYGKPKGSTPTTQLHPHAHCPPTTPKAHAVVWRQPAKLDKQGCGAAPLINKRCSAPWGGAPLRAEQNLPTDNRVSSRTMNRKWREWTNHGNLTFRAGLYCDPPLTLPEWFIRW